MSDTDEHLTMINDCEDRESKLTDWERDFISSLPEAIDKYGSLTEKQADKLETIWERIT